MDSLKEVVKKAKEHNNPDYVRVYYERNEGSMHDGEKILNVKPMSSAPDRCVDVPQYDNQPTFYGKPCLLCEKKDYYLTSIEVKQDGNGRWWNTFIYFCPNCSLQYKEYDSFEWYP